MGAQPQQNAQPDINDGAMDSLLFLRKILLEKKLECTVDKLDEVIMMYFTECAMNSENKIDIQVIHRMRNAVESLLLSTR